MSSLIRIAAGQLTANDLLSDDSTLVTNWPVQTDMLNTSFRWSASQPEKGLQQEYVGGLGLGTGGYYGGYSGIVNIFLATPLMRKYLFQTIFSSKPTARVTAYLHTPNDAFEWDEFQVVYGELVWPVASNAEAEYTRFSDKVYHTMQLEIRRATIVTAEFLVTESGIFLTTEDGAFISLED